MSSDPIRIFFWNVGGRSRAALLCELVKDMRADIVVLIESIAPVEQVLSGLREGISQEFYEPALISTRFQVFSKDRQLDVSETYSSGRTSFRNLSIGRDRLNFGIVHLVDKRNWDSAHQSHQALRLSEEIREQEERAGHDRTIILGDFNMNPFEQPMNMATGLNAMMTRKCTEKKYRTLQGKSYPYFFNPMWGLLGDRVGSVPGTYYHTGSSNGHYGWNTLDQVLVRPNALPWYHGVEIVSKTDRSTLQSPTFRPNTRSASDHFPILLQLKRECDELLA